MFLLGIIINYFSGTLVYGSSNDENIGFVEQDAFFLYIFIIILCPIVFKLDNTSFDETYKYYKSCKITDYLFERNFNSIYKLWMKLVTKFFSIKVFYLYLLIIAYMCVSHLIFYKIFHFTGVELDYVIWWEYNIYLRLFSFFFGTLTLFLTIYICMFFGFCFVQFFLLLIFWERNHNNVQSEYITLLKARHHFLKLTNNIWFFLLFLIAFDVFYIIIHLLYRLDVIINPLFGNLKKHCISASIIYVVFILSFLVLNLIYRRFITFHLEKEKKRVLSEMEETRTPNEFYKKEKELKKIERYPTNLFYVKEIKITVFGVVFMIITFIITLIIDFL